MDTRWTADQKKTSVDVMAYLLLNPAIKLSDSSDPGSIRFFPARPPQWKSGSIKGLRLRGAISLKELTWGDGQAKAVLVSDKDQTVTIFTPSGKKETRVLKSGEPVEVNCQL
ncbi:MAG: glycoside hydrolase family 95-like protein [Verrucomicrobiota bacterium]